MASYVYDDFAVTFRTRADGAYDVRAVDAAGTHSSGTFTMPLSDDDLQRAVLQVARSNSRKAKPAGDPTEPAPPPVQPAAPAAPATRDIGGAGLPAINAVHFGRLLADALFNEEIGAHYVRAKQASGAKGAGLRLSLSLGDAPALTNVPWEFIYRRPTFLASQRHTPVVRWLDTGALAAPPAIEGTVRILGVIASPGDQGSLDVAAERTRIEDATRTMCELGRVELDWLDPATPRRLREVLRDGSYHILHYVGHSDYTAAGEGVLVLEDGTGGTDLVDGTALANLLSDQTRLRLVVLNSCEGARTSLTDPYAGVATTLIQLGVPAVVAMQFEISDRAAIVFGEELYTNLIGRQDPIDAAVGEARKAILIEVDDVEWATPVLYMRDPQVDLFTFEIAAADLPPPPPPIPADALANEDVITGRHVIEPDAGGGSDEPPSPPEPEPEPASAGAPWKRIGAIAGGIAAVAAAVVGLVAVVGGGDDDPAASDDSAPLGSVLRGDPGDGSVTVPPRANEPRPHSDTIAVQVARPSDEIHLLLIDTSSGAVATASDNPDAQDTNADWDPSSNHLAFVRTDPTPARCVGICDVVPGVGAEDAGRRVAQLIPHVEGRREHAPAWSRSNELFYASERSCPQPTECVSEIRRASFDQTADGTGFNDLWTVAADDLVIGGVQGVLDIDVDPQDDLRLAIVDAEGVVIVREGEVVQRLEGNERARSVTYAPDGNRVAALMEGGQLAIWDRDGNLVETPRIGDLLTELSTRSAYLGSIEPSEAIVLSVTASEQDSDLIVMFGQQGSQQQEPEFALVGTNDDGRSQIVDTEVAPAALLDEGDPQAISF